MSATTDQNEDYEAFIDPIAKSWRELAQISVFWAIFWGGVYLVVMGVSEVLGALLPDAYSGAGAAFSIFVGLATGITLLFYGDSPAGTRVKSRAKLFVKRYSFPLLFALGLWGGSEWRERHPSNPERAAVLEWASRACGRLPECVENTSHVVGNTWTVEHYIVPIIETDARGKKIYRYAE